MNKQIIEERSVLVLRDQKIAYSSFWLILLAVFLIGSYGTALNGLLAENATFIYVVETVQILATAAVIPLALQLFNKKVAKLKEADDLELLLVGYAKWSNIRLGLLFVVALIGLLLHYLCVSSTAGLCTLIICFAALFCVPSKSKLDFALSPSIDTEGETEDDLNKEEEEE